MASAWGLSWGKAWGNSWGLILTGGGGASATSKRRKRSIRGWANERAIFELSRQPTVEDPTPRVIKKVIRRKAPVVTAEEFQGLDQLQRELETAYETLERKKALAREQAMAQAEAEAFLHDEEEAIAVLLMLLDYERNLIGIPMGLKSSSS